MYTSSRKVQNHIIRDNRDAIQSLPFMRPQMARLMVSLGVPEDKVNETVIRRGREGSEASVA